LANDTIFPEEMMATIKLRKVSFDYGTSPQQSGFHLFQSHGEHNQEDSVPKTQGGMLALDSVDLTIPNGQMFVIVGPSGCGKSTLLRVVAGLERNYIGQVLYDGEDMQAIPPNKRTIGIVFQNYALYPNFTGEGNLSFYFKVHDIPDEETRKRIEYTSQLMGIGFKELLPRRPVTLSGGERQRVAIARAIVRAPQLFLLDEPLSNLDAKLRVQTRTEIKRLLHRFGITTLYVTHDQVEAIALADQIVVMHSGRVEQTGTYKSLIENPHSLFVAGFLGLPPMDLLPSGAVLDGRLVLGEYAFPLPESLLPLLQNGQQVTMGLRRETVKVFPAGEADRAIHLQADVDAFESDFVHRLHTVFLRRGRLQFSGHCPLDMQLHVGQQVPVEIQPENLYFFDTLSGRRL
jgi:ABC-type sugar transport system ATPase subunit